MHSQGVYTPYVCFIPSPQAIQRCESTGSAPHPLEAPPEFRTDDLSDSYICTVDVHAAHPVIAHPFNEGRADAINGPHLFLAARDCTATCLSSGA